MELARDGGRLLTPRAPSLADKWNSWEQEPLPCKRAAREPMSLGEGQALVTVRRRIERKFLESVLDVEFVYSGMRVTKSSRENTQKENSNTRMERTEVRSGPGKGLKVQQLSFHPCITVPGRHRVGAQLIYLSNRVSQ